MHRRALATWIAGGAVLVLTALLFAVRVPYSILSPGPVCNTVGNGNPDCPSVSGGSLITVSPASRDHPSASVLGFTTVSVNNQDPSIATALGAWLTASEAVVPREVIEPPGSSQQQVDKQNRQDMKQAQDAAVIAAEAALGLVQVSVAGVQPGFPAAGQLQVGDEILAVDGTPIGSAQQLIARTSGGPADRPYVFTVRRAGRRLQVSLTRKPSPTDPSHLIFGISLAQAEGSVHVKITLDPSKIGGPSAGLMFALGVYDRLTPGELTGGVRVAGTGTIDQFGTVGPIGGIAQKMYAARHSFDARVFLAPADDCADARGAIPAGLRVVKIRTFDDALAALAAVRDGKLAALPGC